MKIRLPKPNRWNTVILFFLVIFSSVLHSNAFGQEQLTMRDFVLYGKQSAQLGTSTTITGGRIGSNQLVTTVGNTNITASINSNNLVQLSNSNTIDGNISAKNQAGSNGVVFSTGSNFSFINRRARIDVGGNVSIQSGTVNGTLYMPSSAVYSGPKVLRKDKPVFPIMPALPPIATFAAAGTMDVTSSQAVLPQNSYRDLVLDGGKVVTFSGTGIYTFKSISISGQNNQFVLDFKGSTTGFITIRVHGDVNLDKINVQLKNGGDASRVFMEVHGNGSTSSTGSNAWQIANGSSGSTQGIWYGAVWAPYGGIFVGQGSSASKIEGALWSGTNVVLGSGVSVTYVRPANCPDPVADAGAGQTIVCPATTVTIGTANSSGADYKWTTLRNGVETIVGTTPTIQVTDPGTYTLTVSNECGYSATSSVVVGYQSCVDPINPNTGKVENLIGHELTYLPTSPANIEEAKKYLIIFDNTYVLIEAVAVLGHEDEAKEFLIGLGLTGIIPNGLDQQIISGKFPIAKLDQINARPDIINHCRPVFQPVSNAGLATSEGDKAIAADAARGGFKIGGEGIKIGVISDSYNKREPGVDYAQQDVDNDDLPGVDKAGKNSNQTPVEVLQDYPYGQRTDEGRAMLQIVHDLAPQAALAFRTGFLSAGDLAQGIVEMKDHGCNVIVDDVTFVTEPFFQDGVVSKAVDAVNQAGVAYFTSAGNFGQKSYSSTFRPAASPVRANNHAHDFSGTGDIYQHLKLKSGTYTIVLQWKDNIYSLAQTTGTINDLDLYLVDKGGRIGFNRNNVGGDPFEVLSFSINLPDTSQVIDADLLIDKADQSGDNPLFKYVIFRGNAVIDEYYSEQPLVNKSTIVGHANARGAVAVGAVLFSNTAPYGRTPSTASFSSSGGTPVYVDGIPEVRRKPELIAPNGVNTSSTVVMGPDIDFATDPVNGSADGFPNFYGTSAAAPHAAAAAALVLEARKKFYNETLSPDQLRYYLFNTAIAMQPDGVVNNWNYKAGYGLVQPYAAIRAFANPTPSIDKLVYDASITPGTTAFTLTVEGSYFTAGSQIYFRGEPITTTVVNDSTLQGTIPQFNTGNPPINVYTPSFNGASGDGGMSNTLYFFTPAKLKVVIQADNKTKKYGEVLPQNSATIFVEGDSLQVYNQKNGTNLTPTSLGLTNIQYSYSDPGLNALSDKGVYSITGSRTFDPNNATDVGLLEVYDYDSMPGKLTIEKLAVTITPQDITAQYGDQLTNKIAFNYTFDPTAHLANVDALTNIIKTAHAANIDNSVLGVMNSTGGTAVVFFQNQMLPVYNSAAIIYQNKIYPVLSGTGGTAVVLLNDGSGLKEHQVVNGLITGGAAVILNGTEYPVVNGGGAVLILNGEIIPVTNKVDGSAVVIVNGIEYSVTKGSASVIINGTEYPIINGGGGAVLILNGEYHPVVNKVDGSAVVIVNGLEYPVVNGALTGGAAVILNGTEYPVVNTASTATTILNGQLYQVQANSSGGGASILLNGQVQTNNAPFLNGFAGSASVILNGKIEPVYNQIGGGAVLILNGETLPVVRKADGSAVVIVNGISYPVSSGSATVIINGTEYPVVNGIGGAVVVLNGDLVPVTTNGLTGAAEVILNSVHYPVTNSISPEALTNMSLSATLNAISNARVVNSISNKLIDVAANAFVQFNANSAQSSLLNTYAAVNRTLVDANRLANGSEIVVNGIGGSATIILNGSGSASTILNGGTVVDPSSLNGTVAKFPVVFDQADLNSTTNGGLTVTVQGINMITGLGSGQQYLIPATMFSPNFDISFKPGNVKINPAGLCLTAKDITKELGDATTINQANFTITSGGTKYREAVALATITSPGTSADAPIGQYTITIKDAAGSYGTDMKNYALCYNAGQLTIGPSSCPVLTHSRDNNFVSTTRDPISLWLSISIKVRGQLTKAGDYISFKGGQLTLDNVAYSNSNQVKSFSIKPGIVVASQEVTEPTTLFDAVRGEFVTKVPLGFSSTADIFISGAVANSATGFIKKKNAGSVVSGIFQSNVSYDGQWNYAMAAYSPLKGTGTTVLYFQSEQLAHSGDVVAMSTNDYKAGTPKPWISRIVDGGTGNGGSNYTGSPTSNDNFTSCVKTTTGGQVLVTKAGNNSARTETTSATELKIFPNPASTTVTLAFVPSVNGPVTIRVFSADGAQTYRQYEGIGEAKKLYTRMIDTRQWAKGIYVIQFITNNQVINRKLVVTR